MKRILFILLITCSCYSQDRIEIGIFQDAKLGLGLDKEHKNDSPTLDITIYLDLQGKQFKHYYFSMQPFYNQAELYSGYLKRYGVNSVWNFNELIINDLTASVGAGISMLLRKGIGVPTYQMVLELTYYKTKRLKIGLRYEYVRRADLEDFRSNGLIGLKYNLIQQKK